MQNMPYVLRTRGGARLISDPHHRNPVAEAGISSVTGLGNVPTGESVYQAARMAGTQEDGLFIMSIEGVRNDQGPQDEKYGYEGEEKILSRTVYKQDILDAMQVLRGGGGSGAGDQTHLPFDTDTNYNNTFLRILSEESGFGWDAIARVQFIQ